RAGRGSGNSGSGHGHRRASGVGAEAGSGRRGDETRAAEGVRMTPDVPAPTLNRPKHGSQRFEVEGDTMIINMGPQHPSTHGVLRLEIETDGEVLKSVVPHMGYLHRCFEKHSENLTWPQVIPYVDRMDYLGAMTNE